LYHEGQFVHIGDKEEDIDIEFAAPIGGPVPKGDRVKVRELPQTTVAYAVHHGRFSGLPLIKRAIFSWIQDNGYRRAGPIREVYLHHDPDHEANADSPHHVTEVQFPVEKD
jgi:effector-binding domain-containing protein